MRRLLLTASMLAAFTATPALLLGPKSAQAEEFTRAQIEQIIKEYIQNHPKEMIDSVENFGKQQQIDMNKAASEQIQKNSDWLLKNPHHAQAGNPKGDVTIVEFFDYNCGYCKQALSDLMKLLDQDKKVRLVFVEIPILGQSSEEAARWALASLKQDRYLEFHIALMGHKGPLDEGAILQYAQKVGLDVEKLKKDRLDPENDKIIAENLNMARTLGIQGTPAFVVGDELIRGYVGADGLLAAVNEARAPKPGADGIPAPTAADRPQ